MWFSKSINSNKNYFVGKKIKNKKSLQNISETQIWETVNTNLVTETQKC